MYWDGSCVVYSIKCRVYRDYILSIRIRCYVYFGLLVGWLVPYTPTIPFHTTQQNRTTLSELNRIASTAADVSLIWIWECEGLFLHLKLTLIVNHFHLFIHSQARIYFIFTLLFNITEYIFFLYFDLLYLFDGLLLRPWNIDLNMECDME